MQVISSRIGTRPSQTLTMAGSVVGTTGAAPESNGTLVAVGVGAGSVAVALGTGVGVEIRGGVGTSDNGCTSSRIRYMV